MSVATANLDPLFYETKVQYFAGSAATGKLLKTVQTDYVATGTPLPIRRTTTLNDANLVSKTETSYDSFSAWSGTFTNRNVLSQSEYAFGTGAPGGLVRQTSKSYLHTGNPAYLNLNIVNKVLTDTVYDGAGSQKARTQYEYDNYVPGVNALISTSGAPQHDYINYPAAFIYRGNATRVSRWRNTDNALLTTTSTYDDLGNLRAVADPLGHTTSFSYNDSFANGFCPPAGNSMAYLSQVTDALGHRVQTVRYPCTGLVQSHKDENDILAGRAGATYTYDLMNRPLIIKSSDGGQTSYIYNNGVPFTATETKAISSTVNLVSTNIFDNFGRVKQGQLTSDPDGFVYTDTTYDALGRPSTISNPHRASSDPGPTNGITATQYDALNRPCAIVPPDGTAILGTTCPLAQPGNDIFTTYAGNTTTVTDQAGKTRKSVTDALGRLAQVFEDPNGLNYETDYQYDALNNLIQVDQKGNSTQWRTRTFTYNSLSQLLAASNPESGIVTYAYDNNGNLLTKKDARNITTTFAYDSLNRLTGKTFSNTDPAISYYYDQSSYNGLTIGNGIGRRTGMSDAAGTEAWSLDLTPGIGWKTTDSRTTSGVTKTTTVQHNLDGSEASVTYPSGRIITYAPSAAGRTLSAVDKVYGINYASNAHYTPQGALASTLNGASLASTFVFNNRLQPCWMYATTGTALPWNSTNCNGSAPTGNLIDLKYSFSLGAADNSNVTAITNNRDTTRSQSFSYDSLNRIASAQTTATTGAKCWGETFGVDPWGNLLSIGGIVPQYNGCTQENLSVMATTKNQISGDTYDVAGNLTATPAPASASYTYDAESRLRTAAGVTYTYDGDGKRVKKSSGKLYWYGEGTDALDESDASGNITDEYVFFDGKRIAHRKVASGEIDYYFADHLGTSRVVANASGAVLDDSDFYPFGTERTYTTSSGNNYKFTGKERDAESGLDYFGARYYSSITSRWLTPDWSAGPTAVPYADLNDPQSLNLYTYVRNNPMNRTDPDGHACFFGRFGSGCDNPPTPPPPPPQTASAAIALVMAIPVSLPQAATSAAGAGVVGAGALVAAGAGLVVAAGSVAITKITDAYVGKKNDQITLDAAASQNASIAYAQSVKGGGAAQDKKLTNEEVKTLVGQTGQNAHEIKADALGTKKNLGKYDLYKDRAGNVSVKPKGGREPGEPTGYNINEN
ncbi:MAG: polymorphic toxin type 33 domain-containing protein [Acidobacteriota bacterium]|nr:polymorphic toxin type 33 domain-containing protein [Acidobacteriota bacterium]